MLSIPEIWPSHETPDPEVESLKDLYANLSAVRYNVEAWGSALELFRFSKQKPLLVSSELARGWSFIAAHECVHQLHHLRVRLEQIKGYKVRACPSLKPDIDTKALRLSTRKLDEYFPHIDPMRNAIAHSGAHEVKPEEHAPPSGWLLTRLDDSGRFSTYYQGSERFIDISQESLARILEVATTFLEGFRQAAQILQKQGYADER
jgi:hypothetical protein